MMATKTNPTSFSRLAWRASAVLLGLLAPAGGQAAPFCLGTQSVPPQCIYYDADSCRREAGRQGGVCSANPQEVRVSSNIGQFCVMTSQQVSLCIYLDRGTCEIAAAHQHGACVSSPGVAPSGAPDPFSPTMGR
jgi:hypothetical protein